MRNNVMTLRLCLRVLSAMFFLPVLPFAQVTRLHCFPDPKNRARPTTSQQANAIFATELQWEVANYVSNDISLECAKKHVLPSHDRIVKHMRVLKNKDTFASYLDIFASALDPHSNY